MLSTRTHLPIGLWTLSLGITGFAAGFFGPIVLNPEANQGPLVGLFITGPGGALGGLILGTLLRFAPLRRAVHAKSLLVACCALGLGTLYFCLPPPKTLAYVIEADVAQCAPPSHFAEDSLETWQDAVKRADWYVPPANWQQTALRNVDAAPGVVLTMRIVRRASIREHRKPWDFRRRTITPWESVEEPERYYSTAMGSDCSAYATQAPLLYVPFVSGPNRSDQPAPEWPPTDVTSFLRLMELGPVPIEYRALVEQVS
jgi:hypothetical protein